MTTYARPVVNGTPTTGQTIKAAHINEPVDFLFDTVLAGGITTDQLGALSVTEGKIATAAVTQTKIEGTLPDGSTLAAATESGDPDRTIADKGFVDTQITTLDTDGSTITAWVNFTGQISNASLPTNMGIKASKGVTSVSKTSTGTYLVTFSTAFAADTYGVATGAEALKSTDSGDVYVSSINKTTTQVEVFVFTTGGALDDKANDYTVMAIGAQ